MKMAAANTLTTATIFRRSWAAAWSLKPVTGDRQQIWIKQSLSSKFRVRRINKNMTEK